MRVHFIQGSRADLESAIANQSIELGSIIFTNDDDNVEELYLYDIDGTLKNIAYRNRFDSMDEAMAWVTTYDCAGQIIAVCEGDEWNIYSVLANRTLSPVGKPQVQADWNENDENSVSYVKNRTHYHDVVKTEVVSETTITTTEANQQIYFSNANIDWSFIDEVGSKFKVVFDGIEYECVADQTTDTSASIGNHSLTDGEGVSENTGEPFEIVQLTSPTDIRFVHIAEAGEHTFSVTRIDVDTLRQLDEKFIPTATDDEILALLEECDAISVVKDENGTVVTDEDGNIILW